MNSVNPAGNRSIASIRRASFRLPVMETCEIVGGAQPIQRAGEFRRHGPHPYCHRTFRQRCFPVDAEIERPPNPANSEFLRHSRHGAQYRRQQMRVLVGIDVLGRIPTSTILLT